MIPPRPRLRVRTLLVLSRSAPVPVPPRYTGALGSGGGGTSTIQAAPTKPSRRWMRAGSGASATISRSPSWPRPSATATRRCGIMPRSGWRISACGPRRPHRPSSRPRGTRTSGSGGRPSSHCWSGRLRPPDTVARDHAVGAASRALGDPDAMVRIVAAQSLASVGHGEAALPTLSEP